MVEEERVTHILMKTINSRKKKSPPNLFIFTIKKNTQHYIIEINNHHYPINKERSVKGVKHGMHLIQIVILLMKRIHLSMIMQKV